MLTPSIFYLRLSLFASHYCYLSKQLMAMHFPIQDADMMFDAYDIDNNEQLSYKEFTSVLLKRKPLRTRRGFLGTNSCIG